jgi:hypothetical protein
MKYEKLTHGNIVIYKTKLDGVNDVKLLEEVYANKRYLFYDNEYNDEMLHLPGLQMTGDLMTGDETSVIKKRGYDVCKSIFELENPKKTAYSGLQTTWFYISTPSNPNTQYHDHLLFSQKEKGILTHYTWIYYIQLPDNCTGKEGHIFFKDLTLRTSSNDDDAYSFFPEQGYLYMWDSEIPHRPELSPNSTLDRVIIAGNVNFNTHIK